MANIFLSFPTKVYVEIVDVNDHLPLSSWPVYWPVVAENAEPGTMVVTVNASDPDPGANISYAITAGNPQSLFSIDAKTGELGVHVLSSRFRLQIFAKSTEKMTFPLVC